GRRMASGFSLRLVRAVARGPRTKECSRPLPAGCAARISRFDPIQLAASSRGAPANQALHLTGPALRVSETPRSLQPARQVNAVVRPPPLASPVEEGGGFSFGGAQDGSPRRVTALPHERAVRCGDPAPAPRRSQRSAGRGERRRPNARVQLPGPAAAGAEPPRCGRAAPPPPPPRGQRVFPP